MAGAAADSPTSNCLCHSNTSPAGKLPPTPSISSATLSGSLGKSPGSQITGRRHASQLQSSVGPPRPRPRDRERTPAPAARSRALAAQPRGLLCSTESSCFPHDFLSPIRLWETEAQITGTAGRGKATAHSLRWPLSPARDEPRALPLPGCEECDLPSLPLGLSHLAVGQGFSGGHAGEARSEPAWSQSHTRPSGVPQEGALGSPCLKRRPGPPKTPAARLLSLHTAGSQVVSGWGALGDWAAVWGRQVGSRAGVCSSHPGPAGCA